MREGYIVRYYGPLKGRAWRSEFPDGLLLRYEGIKRNELVYKMCERCGRPLDKDTAHTFSDDVGSMWRFGTECAKYVYNQIVTAEDRKGIRL